MRIAVASTFVPFQPDNRRRALADLETALRRQGHAVEPVRLPVHPSSWRDRPDQLLALRLLEVDEANGNPIDRLIALDFPAHALRHPAKVVWLLPDPPARLWQAPYPGVPDTSEGRSVREAVSRVERASLAEAVAVFAGSSIAAGRLREYAGRDFDGILHPPLLDPGTLRSDAFDDLVVCTSSPRLALDALARTRPPLRLVLLDAGDPDELERLAHESGVGDRVLVERAHDQQQRADVLARACGVLALGDERAVLEAMHAGKPVLALRDEGGGHDLVRDGTNGLLVAADAGELSDALERLAGHKARAAEMGRAARATLDRLPLRWDDVLPRLGIA